MDTQQLDSLILDYSLGALPPDVAALLEAYAATNPRLEVRMAEWRGTADLARRAGQGPRTALPAFPRRRLEQADRSAHARRAVGWITAAAACILIGFAAGAQWPPVKPTGSNPSAISSIETLPRPPHPTHADAEIPVAAVTDFWSVDRLRSYARQQSAQATSANRQNKTMWPDVQWIGG
jgi:hypothetical protein